jgi:hypothetical protein
VRAHTSKTTKKPNLDKLIAMEWDILRDLKKKLSDPELSTGEQVRVANALAYHASVLNKLLGQKGEDSQQFNNATLGDFILNVDAKMRRYTIRSFKIWMKRLSSKK